MQPQRNLLSHLSSPVSSWPTQLNPGVGPTGWISYLGMRVRSIFAHSDERLVLIHTRRTTFSRSQISKKNNRQQVIAARKPCWLAMNRTTTWSG